ncbi:MAG: hypothetical protein HY398_01945 [Candidatus Doudnabacteria bacterium]|nr:hypothetical protein [Candidatus Doudnabacteria bacterium]
MNRRTFILIIVVLLFVGTGVGAYYLLVKQPGSKTEVPVVQEEPAPRQPELLVAETVISPVLSFNGETVWFMSREGRLYRQAIEAGAVKEEYLLPASPAGGPAPITNPARVIWQQRGNDFIVEQSVDGHTRYQFYGADKKVFTIYDERIRDPAFLADDKQVVYIWVGEGGRAELSVAAPDTANYVKLSDLYGPDYELVVSSAKNQVLLFVDDAQNPDNLLLVDLDTVRYTLLDEKVRYSGAKFSPDGNFAVAEKAGALVIYDLQSLSPLSPGEGSPLSNSSPLSGGGEVGGVAWSSDSRELYIFAAGKIRAYNVLTQEWREVYTFPADSLLGPAEIFLHPTKPILFFTDSASGYLYRLDLQ